MDDVLGQLVKALEETGQLENTLIILTSDNGPECEIPPHGRTPFRGCKGSSWEGGVRVPTFAYWKGMISAAQVRRPVRPGRHPATPVMSLAGSPGRRAGRVRSRRPPTSTASIRPSFLVADDGESARRSRPYTLNQYFATMRIDEFKYIFTAEIENARLPEGRLGRLQRRRSSPRPAAPSASTSTRTRRRT